jgi:HTH-type transcriptional regulator/antitoxin HigA
MWLLQPASTAPQETTFETEEAVVNRTKTAGPPASLPDTYFELVKQHPLRSIGSEIELDAAQALLDTLVQQELDEGGLAYLEALSDLVIVYEQEHHAIASLPPHDLLAHLLAERGMSQADLVRATDIAKATVSDLVTGKRPFTVEQMHAVARVFGLPAAVFMREPADRRR